jgi:multiple antibiotic resistance protein
VSDFWLCFVPLFVAVDPIGILPLYVSLTAEFTPWQRRQVNIQSLATATVVAVGFLFLGQWVLGLLEITIGDFMVAGGGLLFVLAVSDMLPATAKEPRGVDPASIGAVPLGVPLTIGPAALATVILLANRYGRWPAVLALVANLMLVGLAFSFSQTIERLLGRIGTRTVSKIMGLVLAAFAVKMIRAGVAAILAEWK